MSDPGHGPPVDALDTVCKAYKDCQKCARMEHGDTCIGEFVRYKYGEKNGDKFCKDTAGSCDRALCECDLAFAKAHVSKAHVFTTDYHLFWSTLPNGWDPKDNCPRGKKLRENFTRKSAGKSRTFVRKSKFCSRDRKVDQNRNFA